MLRKLSLPISLLLTVALCFAAYAQDGTSKEKGQEFYQLIQTVQDLLHGRTLDQTKAIIADGASLVCGAETENLKAVLSGHGKKCSLVEPSSEGVMVRLKTNDEENAGYMILQTQSADKKDTRFHTIVFMKDSTGQLKIESWHASK